MILASFPKFTLASFHIKLHGKPLNRKCKRKLDNLCKGYVGMRSSENKIGFHEVLPTIFLHKNQILLKPKC